MSSPITEVKPSQVAQLMKENKKLKEQLVDKDDEISCHCEQIEKLEEELNRYPEGAAGYTGEEFDELVSVMEDIENHPNYEATEEEIEKLKLSISCLEAERDYVDPKGKFNYIDDYSDFNNHLKEKYNDDMYKKMYEWFDMDNMLDEDEE